MSVVTRFVLVALLIILAALYIFPWKQAGIALNNDFFDKPYVLGLDLQGGVELDYQVDFSTLESQTGSEDSLVVNQNTIVEGIKKVIDKRVGSLGLAEPNIQTLRYGSDVHIIVQIPTESYSDLSPEERKQRQQQDIKNAKNVIGKVVQLEFKEMRIMKTDEDYAERRAIAESARIDMENMDFDTLSQKYMGGYERVIVKSGEGTLPTEATIPSLSEMTIESFPYISEVNAVEMDVSNATGTGYAVVRLESPLGDDRYRYSYVLVDAEPSIWKPAMAADGRVLNDRYLVNAAAGINQGGGSEVQLTFNEEGRQIFAELTGRLVGQQIAIFVGGEMLTAPVVQTTISDGRAVITGQSSFLESQQLANDINTGIVPAPIYLTSERTIDAKIGETALSSILKAGAMGLVAIVIFLAFFYGVSGLLAGIALVAYTILLVAIVKMSGVVLTLAAIAGVILSIGLAIDANILIFERIHEALKEKMPLSKAISIGFKHSWAAIWDSHITSFMSAFILFAFGVAMIKGFGFMLGVGIMLSLFTAMWVSRILLLFAAKYIKNPKIFIGYKK